MSYKQTGVKVFVTDPVDPSKSASFDLDELIEYTDSWLVARKKNADGTATDFLWPLEEVKRVQVSLA